MPNSTVPAADEGLPNLNRRSALAKMGMGIAGSASLATVAAAAAPQSIAVSPKLLLLIDDYKKAEEHFNEAAEANWSAQSEFYKAWPDGVPVQISDYNRLTKKFSDGIDACKEEIADRTRAFQSVWSEQLTDLSKIISAKAVRQQVAAYKTIGTDLVLLVGEAFRAREEAKLDFKLTAMQGAAEAASAALRTATMALCSYRCSTLPDAQAKMAALVGGALDIEETRAVFLSSKQDI